MPTPFETLGIEPSFDVDLPSLEKRYRELARVVHPDKFAGAGAQERRRAASMSVDVNAAFRLVKDPIRRAEALLAVHGIATDERSQPKASPTLLMDVMELREELSEARAAKDLPRVKALAESVESRQNRVLAKVGEGFRELTKASETAQTDALVALLGELRYTRRFLDEVAATIDEIADDAHVTK